uniref:UPAR/Ly6 domain-containing protein n=1 Tax=Panagrolaimus davidi TaxID=227884 RepID=A0A914PPY6_9BILA
MKLLLLIFVLFYSTSEAAITCYKSVNVYLPGAPFDIKGVSRKCLNSESCVRSFGIINGQPGSFSSCVSKENENQTCGNYPACMTETKGNGDTLYSLTTCCCKKNLCNSGTFEGETPETLAKTEKISKSDITESLNKAVKR